VFTPSTFGLLCHPFCVMEVATKAGELQEKVTFKATQLSVASRSDCMDRQWSVQQAMHAQTIAVHREAVQNDKKMARESNQSQELKDFAKIFRESGEAPMEATRLARGAVQDLGGGQ
jgi:hypothetical protein